MKKIEPEDLLSAGVHFGHKSWRVHPKARPFIYKMERGSSIIDLFQTADQLQKAKDFVFNLGSENKSLLVVASKKQIRSEISKICTDNDIPYFTYKWVGGFMTNFDEVVKNIKKMTQLEEDKQNGAWSALPKHETVQLEKKMNRIKKVYHGVRFLTKEPDSIFIIDIKKESNVVKESNMKKIPTIALVDTNCDPTLVNYPIVGNDDALTSVMLIVQEIISSFVEGRKTVKSELKPKI
ncbi:30S ribosomal protein S2 [Candidatus Roizmanbacteria bacterium RIFCSPHIGHO2_02_FULL_37_13b]|uniref:Small ribosomal subunit protein uS2 n=1 Tax=Candidatus Roizmanbacteria bacterium RIFCSPLOWO2_02_FULL_36_11 TaxID=1802071 RepID=A0A1F7JCZ8_9BACT|nr:MAG: 30S ribosomal protein S2 [Candidatus Roizmanbacteria bacterium RIFCSPHIGHO2_02_FULL_37_13b]OGK53476.1 MAG: 30S ribosomal protein S2 [Candidatus Roizmanbacteria bacterium RIFCSPLOWO2_02_FULL_36_11]